MLFTNVIFNAYRYRLNYKLSGCGCFELPIKNDSFLLKALAILASVYFSYSYLNGD